MLEGHYDLPVRDSESDGYTPFGFNESAEQAKQSTLRYLRQIGTMVSGRDDIKIKIVEQGKYIGFTDGQVIYIRNGDFTNPAYRKLVNGLIDHEAGHVKHSDLEYLKSLKLSPPQLGLFNPIEDVRMEQCVKAEYPGAAANLEGMCELLVERGGADYHSQPFPVMLQGYVMLYCRYHFNDDLCMHSPMLVTRNTLTEMMGEDFIHRLESILNKVEGIVRIQQIKPVVDELIQVLEEHKDRAESNDEQGSEQDTESTSSEVSADPGQNKASFVSSEHLDKECSAQNEDESVTKSSGQGLPKESKAPVNKSKLIKQLFNADTADFLPDYHDYARSTMDSMAESAYQDGLVDHFLTDRKYIINPPIDKTYFDTAMSQALFRQLAPLVKKAFFSMLPKPGEYRSRGSQLAPERFAHALSGRSTVFKDEPIRRQSVANVHISVDCSQSMAGTGEAMNSPMLAANNAVFALAMALYQLPRVNVQVDYYSSNKEILFYRACMFGKPPLEKAFGLKPSGSTPMPSAIKEATYSLCHKSGRPGQRNYLILIADGKPCGDRAGGENIKKMLTMARVTGIRVFCIAIAGEDKLSTYVGAGFMPDECVFIQSAGQLVSAFENVISTGIFTH